MVSTQSGQPVVIRKSADVRRAEVAERRSDNLRAENAILREALKDFAEHGLRADLHPTVDASTTQSVVSGYTDYLGRLDQSVRSKAKTALRRAFDAE